MATTLIQGQWKSDGLDADGKATWEATKTAEGVDKIGWATTGGSPLNLCYALDPVPPHKYFVQVQILEWTPESSLSVGVVRPSEFLKGYGTTGMFYNGNLTNGKAALKVGYGPYLGKHPHDVVLVKYTELDTSIQVQFHVNQIALQPAPAFEIPKDADNNESFLPCLHGMGELKVSVTVTLDQPPKPTLPVPPQHVLQGDWNLLDAWNIGEDDSTPTPIWPLEQEEQEVTLNVDPSESGIWNFSLHVCNTLRMRRSVLDQESSVWELTGGGGMMCTLMMPPPPYDQVESKLAQALPRWSTMKLVDGRLEISSNDGMQLMARLERRPPGSTVCTSYH